MVKNTHTFLELSQLVTLLIERKGGSSGPPFFYEVTKYRECVGGSENMEDETGRITIGGVVAPSS